jgi:hypothetical protein
MPFQKGQSGNPSGRPKLPDDLRRAERKMVMMARKRSPRMIEILSGIAEDETAPTASRIAAATAILDRAHGRPKQQIEGSVDHKLSLGEQHLDAIRALSREVGLARTLERPQPKVIDAEAVEVTDESRDAAKLVYVAKQQAAE